MKIKNGFTLVELLAVVVILGILSSIAIIAVNKVNETQKQVTEENIVSGILTGAKRYVADHPEVLDNEMQVNLEDLKNGKYTDYDESKLGLSADNVSDNVSIEICPENIKKLKYSFDKYNDCGCEENNDTTNTANKICKENN